MNKVVVGRELYVFWRGKLIYKRWLDRGYGMVFDKYGPPFVPAHRDKRGDA